MRLVYFVHSIVSCWNHGNAHFLRGIARELIARGHEVRVLEPADGWSRTNLLCHQGEAALTAFRDVFPELAPEFYDADDDVAALIDGAEVVVVHEWTDPAVVARIGRERRHGAFVLLFHDTHHRAVSDPAAFRAFDLRDYDGILAFGESLAEIHRKAGWGRRVFVWHEAADTRLFRPSAGADKREGLVWIGNWGDDERSAELMSFLFRPARAAAQPLDVYGVRYPERALALIEEHGGRHRGWIANASVPGTFARYGATVHVPRRYYADTLPGIPTIRVFEALACGIPLVSAPWDDCEELFSGEDYLVARSEEEMTRQLRAVREDRDLQRSLVENGLRRISSRHTCAHRVDELLSIVNEVRR